MKKTPSIRQMKYAYSIMNESKTKYRAAIDAGFATSTARVPFLIENKLGFKLAVSQIAGEMENVSMQILFELQARDLSKMDNRTLLHALDVISKTHERFQMYS
ncbi:MAG: hypothetical protein WCP17_03115 [bacterium]